MDVLEKSTTVDTEAVEKEDVYVLEINLEVPDDAEIEHCDAEELDDTEDLAEELLEMDKDEHDKAVENAAKKMKDMM